MIGTESAGGALENSRGTSQYTETTSERLAWVDLIKGVALVWIVLNHFSERLFSYPYIGNPTADWPSRGERMAQLLPLSGNGSWDIPLNLLRYVGWFGDQGVQLFLVLSGFGITWGLLARLGDRPMSLREFYIRRAQRVYPMWWGAHLAFAAVWVVTGWGLSITDPALYLSLAGIRITPGLFYYFAPAWWYIGLLLQLYLVYPLLWIGLRRLGPLWLLCICCTVGFLARAVGLFSFGEYIDAWQRGAVFVTRLPEFAFGISLAAWLHRAPATTTRWLRSPPTAGLAFLLYLSGVALSVSLAGMIVAPFVLGVGAFVVLYTLFDRLNHTSPGCRLWMWVGRHSYAIFLLHHPLILRLVPEGASDARRILWSTIAFVLLSIVGAVGLEWAANWVAETVQRWRTQVRTVRSVLRVTMICASLATFLICGELLVGWLAPQEILGWGERPSLEPHLSFGWRLRPSTQTHLRWQSYDYQVTANELGFPGPAYPEQKPPHALRILITGDAFTSAEGVDTEMAWPRLLEAHLKTELPERSVEVMNFAISGYGPNQYAAVVSTFAPVYNPDLIVIGFFVNEYQDVLWTDDEFRQSIGFGLHSPDSVYAIARLEQLRRWVRLQVAEPVNARILGQPSQQGYFLGNFAALERDREDLTTTGRQRVAIKLEEIGIAAGYVGAKVIIVMIPAPVQVCGPESLEYYPAHGVDLEDATRFDLDQPQRMTESLARSLGFDYYDLRPVLRVLDERCAFQPQNMHWTLAGHRRVAAFLSGILVSEGIH